MTKPENAKIILNEKTYELPVVEGTAGDKGIDISKLRSQTGYITLDEGFANTGSCKSAITYINGEKGILCYRGIPIEVLAENSTFIETAYLIIYGELPTRKQMSAFSQKVLRNASLHEGMMHFFDGGFPFTAHPMAILSSLLNSVGCYYPNMVTNHREQDLEHFDDAAALLLSKVRTIAAMAYRMKNGLPLIYPKRDLGYSQNFLHMMFTEPYHEYYPHDDITKALDLILLLHADHEQNCSTSTVRMVASSGANLFASVSAGVCALWGPLHGGANQQVIQMLEEIHRSGDDGRNVVFNDMNKPFTDYALDETAMEKWSAVEKLRDDVNAVLEAARAEKKIGKALEAHVALHAGDDAASAALVQVMGLNLAELFIVSDCQVSSAEPDAASTVGQGANFPGLTVEVSEARGDKCERCWMHSPTVGADADHPTLCARCAAVVRKLPQF